MYDIPTLTRPHLDYIPPPSPLPCSPWTGKCIGKHNLRYFYSFLTCLFGLVLYVAGCTFGWAISKGIAGGPFTPK